MDQQPNWEAAVAAAGMTAYAYELDARAPEGAPEQALGEAPAA